MRLFLLIIALIIFASCSSTDSTSDLCSNPNGMYEGDLQFRSQGELNNFDWTCYSSINGILKIGPDYPSMSDPITDLTSLSQLEYVNDMDVFSNSLLSSLSGLEDIIIENLFISHNPNLNSLVGLGSITGSLSIRVSPGLESLIGLENVTNLYSLDVTFNENLTSLTGLDNLNSVSHGIFINLNESLLSLNGLNSLGSVKIMDLNDNESLTTINALSNLTTISGDGSYFIIRGNHNSLASLQGLGNIETVGELVIENTTSLTNLIGICSLNSIQGNLRIINNEGLINLEGVSGTELNGKLTIIGNLNLNSILGLSGLMSTKRIDISNSALTTLDGLEDLILVDGPIQIQVNSVLIDFCALNTLFSSGTINGTFGTTNNAFNPTQSIMESGNCSN
ncbi:hypothetical protein [Winogradskyella sp.]|uniref:hypothetical protein n=1 Tax=Winogradskyella sp. TaxID=1883156 RepID=UPI003F6D5223